MLTLAGQLKHKATDEQYSKTGLIYLYDIFSGLQHDLCQAKQCVQGLLDINTPADISSQGLHNLPLVGFSADLNMKNKDKCLPVNLLLCTSMWKQLGPYSTHSHGSDEVWTLVVGEH